MNKCTPENITELQPNEVFIFGSNLSGFHAGGAAKQAHEQFGAVWGVGEGLTGQTYAFPTLDGRLEQLQLSTLASVRDAFYRCVKSHPDLTFLLTRVGCGIAGYKEEDICELFRYAPGNVVKPGGW